MSNVSGDTGDSALSPDRPATSTPPPSTAPPAYTASAPFQSHPQTSIPYILEPSGTVSPSMGNALTNHHTVFPHGDSYSSAITGPSGDEPSSSPESCPSPLSEGVNQRVGSSWSTNGSIACVRTLIQPPAHFSTSTQPSMDWSLGTDPDPFYSQPLEGSFLQPVGIPPSRYPIPIWLADCLVQTHYQYPPPPTVMSGFPYEEPLPVHQGWSPEMTDW